jgi:5-methylcytosine-specific restriction endonuclease McrA
VKRDRNTKALAERAGRRLRVHLSEQRRSCTVCSEPFQPSTATHKTCSSVCKIAWAKQRAVAHRGVMERRCRECAAEFIEDHQHRRIAFCSLSCGNSHNGRVKEALKRARKRHPNSQRVNPLAVFLRDGWECKICFEEAPRQYLGGMHDRAPTLDHIIPLSNGGQHTYQNTQCAHRKCNVLKGAR